MNTRKILHWSKQSPNFKQRVKMYQRCGKKCFLGKIIINKKYGFPICKKNTCKVSKKGIHAAYVRARQWGSMKSNYLRKHYTKGLRKMYKKITLKAKKLTNL